MNSLARTTSILSRLKLSCRLMETQQAALATTQQQMMPWKLGRLNHVAIACQDAEKTSKFYSEVLGAKTSEMMPQPEHGVYTVFVQLDNTKIELLQPLGEKSPISAFLEKNKNGGMHHICLEVDNIEDAMNEIKQKGIRTLAEKTSIGAHGKPVIFLHPKDCGGVLVELEQV